MDPETNPYFSEAEIEHFLATDSGGRTVGRISTTIDPAYVERFGKTGFFGWFETVDDPEVASALLSAAERWLADRGMERVAGPYSYCATQEFGLLVDGFDNQPAVFQPHNPPHYADLLSQAGYLRDFRTDTFSWRADHDADAMSRLARRGEEVSVRLGLRIRDLDPEQWESEIDLVQELLAASFADNHDMVAISKPVLRFQLGELRELIDPRLTRFVEYQGQTVAFSMLAADGNELLKAAGGEVTDAFMERYAELKAGIRGAVVLMIGVRPEHEGLGIGRVLVGEIAKVALGRIGSYRDVHTTWIHEHNWQSRSYMAQTGTDPVRTYAVYGKDLVL
ncbi:N-acetyltransferase [Streptomyces sp. BA2]|uniref:N-acetyltransferase n=1 Tax=Streptomyces sp. BA2 TaxID=436595 RepID=UPI0013285E19|nr:N-acetyltransferase [Streptomyces sp. BA2]MWA14563.1 N-acetyltransferase [Streptomyces sp. BA2]